MDVSFIIPAYNEAKHIAACVRSVRDAIDTVARQRPAVRWRVIVVDNNSTDSTARLARAAAADSGACVGGASTIRFDPPTTWLTPIEPLMNWVMSTLKVTPGAFIFARADAFTEIHGFNTNLFAAEDARIGADLKRWGKSHGLRLVILDRNPVLTSPRKSVLYR